ncbi:hypothetical protein [Glutamicibacter arilaitensis]|uniref:hypothetical protein n=1 Tax=Glutamicibacter arilaitensis TaxID=256701 RepID=UPI003FD2B0ED
MSKQYRNRVPRGQSTGGQFARERRNESKVSLTGATNAGTPDGPGGSETDFGPDKFGEEEMKAVMSDMESTIAERISAVHSMNSGAPDLALADRDPLIRAQTIGLVGSTPEQQEQAIQDPETRRIYEFLTQKNHR